MRWYLQDRKDSEWYEWFAWFPVRVRGERTYVWLETVERRDRWITSVFPSIAITDFRFKEV